MKHATFYTALLLLVIHSPLYSMKRLIPRMVPCRNFPKTNEFRRISDLREFLHQQLSDTVSLRIMESGKNHQAHETIVWENCIPKEYVVDQASAIMNKKGEEFIAKSRLGDALFFEFYCEKDPKGLTVAIHNGCIYSGFIAITQRIR